MGGTPFNTGWKPSPWHFCLVRIKLQSCLIHPWVQMTWRDRALHALLLWIGIIWDDWIWRLKHCISPYFTNVWYLHVIFPFFPKLQLCSIVPCFFKKNFLHFIWIAQDIKTVGPTKRTRIDFFIYSANFQLSNFKNTIRRRCMYTHACTRTRTHWKTSYLTFTITGTLPV